MNELMRLFVVAPHPDDDVIGCGGTMQRVASGGGAVAVAYVTDGSASHPQSRRFDRAAMRALREREALAGLGHVAPHAEVTFCCLPDGGLTTLDAAERATATAMLGEAIRRFAPTLVLAPWRRDPHPDHRCVQRLTRDALHALAWPGEIAEYGVWLSQRGAPSDRPDPRDVRTIEVRLDASTLDCKRRAILEHRSQFGAVVDDDPSGFRIDDATLARWLAPVETFFADAAAPARVASAIAC